MASRFATIADCVLSSSSFFFALMVSQSARSSGSCAAWGLSARALSGAAGAAGARTSDCSRPMRSSRSSGLWQSGKLRYVVLNSASSLHSARVGHVARGEGARCRAGAHLCATSCRSAVAFSRWVARFPQASSIASARARPALSGAQRRAHAQRQPVHSSDRTAAMRSS